MAHPFDCPTSGEVHPGGCQAHRQDGSPCQAPAKRGTSLCVHHTAKPTKALPVCGKCGQSHRHGCKAHKAGRVPLQPCSQRAIKGAQVCYWHGAATPAVPERARQRLERERQRKRQLNVAKSYLETYGKPLDVDPVSALLSEIQWTAGHVQWLREQVQAIERDALIWGDVEEKTAGGNGSARTQIVRRAAPSIWLTLYQQERRHLLEATTAALRAGIEERRVRLAERYGETIAEVFRRLLDDPEFGLDTTQRELGRRLASRHLRALGSREGA